LDEEKSKCAGLAEEIGFDSLIKGIAKAAQSAYARLECKECDLTSAAAPCLFRIGKS
jgi:hypothetical protein